MNRHALRRLETGPLVSYDTSTDVLYVDFSPNNQHPNRRISIEVAPSVIADVSPVRRNLLGLEVLGASSHFEGIADLSKLRRYKGGTLKGHISPEQVLESVERIASQNPNADFIKTAIQENIALRDRLRDVKAGLIT